MSPDFDETEDRSALVQILTWFLLLVGFFSICGRLLSKYVVRWTLKWDDWLIMAAELALLFQSISVSFAASRGLGKPTSTLTASSIDGILKANYASTPLLILALAFTKWSLLAFVAQMCPYGLNRWLDLGLRGLVGLWLASSAVTSLFQCALPTPWDISQDENCFDRRSWWTYVVALNVTTEVGLVGLFISMFRKLQVSLEKRARLLLVFSSRLLVAGGAVAQLVVFINEDSRPNVTGRLLIPTLCNQALACLNIVTACAPYLKPFMESIEPNVVQVHEGESSEEALSSTQGGRSEMPLSQLSSSAASCRPTARP